MRAHRNPRQPSKDPYPTKTWLAFRIRGSRSERYPEVIYADTQRAPLRVTARDHDDQAAVGHEQQEDGEYVCHRQSCVIATTICRKRATATKPKATIISTPGSSKFM